MSAITLRRIHSFTSKATVYTQFEEYKKWKFQLLITVCGRHLGFAKYMVIQCSRQYTLQLLNFGEPLNENVKFSGYPHTFVENKSVDNSKRGNASKLVQCT